MARILYGDAGAECFLEKDTNSNVNNFIQAVYHDAKHGMFYKSVDKSLVVGTVEKSFARGSGFVSAESIDKEKNVSETLKDVSFLSREQFLKYRELKPSSGTKHLIDDVNIPLTAEQLEYLIALMFQVDSYSAVSSQKKENKPILLSSNGGSLYGETISNFNYIQKILKYLPKDVRESFSYFSGTYGAKSFRLPREFDFFITNEHLERSGNNKEYSLDDLKEGLKLPDGFGKAQVTPYIKYLAGVIRGEREQIPEMEEFLDSNPISYKYKGNFKAYDKLATIFIKMEELHKQGINSDDGKVFAEVDTLIENELQSDRILKTIDGDAFYDVEDRIAKRIKGQEVPIVKSEKEEAIEELQQVKAEKDESQQDIDVLTKKLDGMIGEFKELLGRLPEDKRKEILKKLVEPDLEL